jgi:hypothetical protein
LFQRPKQFRKHDLLWDLTFKRKPEPIVEKREEGTEDGDVDGDAEGNMSDQGD